MKYFILLCFVFSLVTFAQDKKEVSFSKDLIPLFKAKCFRCHEQDEENPNDFSMDTYDLLIKGGKTKNMIVPGKGSESYLIIKLLPNPPKGAQMPVFSKKKLPEDEVDLIKRWIDQGAKNN